MRQPLISDEQLDSEGFFVLGWMVLTFVVFPVWLVYRAWKLVNPGWYGITLDFARGEVREEPSPAKEPVKDITYFGSAPMTETEFSDGSVEIETYPASSPNAATNNRCDHPGCLSRVTGTYLVGLGGMPAFYCADHAPASSPKEDA